MSFFERALSALTAASLPGRRSANRVAPPDRGPPPPPPPRARPVNNDAGCTGASDGWSWSRSRASTSNEARTERTTREFTLFGYVVARFETTSAYGQPASES